MQTRTALRHMSGVNHQWGDGPLGQVADQLLEAFRAREADRLESAELAAATMGTGAMFQALQRRFAEAEERGLIDVAAPMVMRFDAYQCLLDASRAAPTDRGLKMATAHAKELWTREPDGVLAVGDVARLRTHWTAQFPRSRVAAVIDQELPKVGFNTLPVAKLAAMAANIRGRDLEELESSYETVVRAHGLDGDRPHQVRARAYLRGLVHLASEPEPTTGPEAGGEAAGDRTLWRMAAFDDPILRAVGQLEPIGLPEGGDEPPVDMAEGAPPHEGDVPHEEEPGSIVQVESPITGEPLALELELEAPPEEGGGMPGEEPPMDFGPEQDVPSEDVEGLQMFGQLDDFMGIEEPEGSPLGTPDAVPAPEEGAGPVTTTIEDPSAPGEMLEVTIAPMGEDPFGEEQALPAVPMDTPLESDVGNGHIASFAVYAIRGGVKANEPLERIAAESMPRALRHVARSLGEVDGNSYPVRAHPETFERQALIVLDAEAGNHLLVVAEGVTRRTAAVTIHTPLPRPVVENPPATVTTSAPMERKAMNQDEVKTVCASLGLTAESIETSLLAAEPVMLADGEGRVAWKIEVDDNGEVALSRGEKVVKRSGLGELDEAIADFLARCASEAGGSGQVVPAGGVAPRAGGYELHPLFLVGCAQCGAVGEYLMPKVASPVACGTCGYETAAQAVAVQMHARQGQALPGYVILADIPGERNELEMNARRLMIAIQQVAPQAVGTLREGKLEVHVRPVDQAGLARIRNVLESRFGVRPVTKTAQGGPTQQEMQTTVPGQVNMVNQSGVPGQIGPTYKPPMAMPTPPVGAQPPAAGVPMAPAPTGTGSQQQFMQDHATIEPAKPVAARFGPPLWTVTYRTASGPMHLEVEAADAQTARRVFRAYDADVEILDVRQAQAALPKGAPPPEGAEPAPDAAPPPAPGAPGAAPPTAPGAMGPGMGMGMQQGAQITPEVQEAIRAAMITLRNTGVDIASAITEFQSQFKQLLLKFGDEHSPGRAQLGGEIVKSATEAWSKPALIDITARLTVRQAWLAAEAFLKDAIGKMPTPRETPVQHGDRVRVPKNVLGPDSSGEEPRVMSPKVKPTHEPKMKMSPTDMSGGDGEHSVDPGDYGAGKPPADGSYGKPSNKGQSWSNTNMGSDSQNKNNPTTSHWDSVSSEAGGHIRSKPGGSGAPDVRKKKKAASELARLQESKDASNDAMFWLSEAVRRAKATGEFPEDELWAARDAGLEQLVPKLPGAVNAIVREALAAL